MSMGTTTAGHRILGALALAAMLAQPVAALAQAADGPGPLQPGDEISLLVPGRPELDQDFTLDAEGAAEISPVGLVQLGGLSRSEATLLLKQKLRLFYPTLDALELNIARTGSVRIYVIGAVDQKGSLSFAVDPTLWEVLRAVGGPSDGANLREARIIRQAGEVPEVFPLDLSGVLEGESVVEFEMKDGDTLVIPSLQEGIPGTDAAEGVKVFGSVAVPTIVPIEEGTPLLDVLMLAGAPTEDADNRKINWVHDTGVRKQATVVDLEAYLLRGDPVGNPLVYPGDTVQVEFSKPGWFRENVPFVLGALAAVATVMLAYDRVIADN